MVWDRIKEREYKARWAERRRQERIRWARKKLGGFCVACGTHELLQFDHIDPSTKEFEVASRAACVTKAAFTAEVAKCQLLCVLCHLDKTLTQRRGGVWVPPDPWDRPAPLIYDDDDPLN